MCIACYEGLLSFVVCLSANTLLLDLHDNWFPQLLSFDLDTSASDDLLSDPLSDAIIDSTLVLLQTLSCIHHHSMLPVLIAFLQCVKISGENRLFKMISIFALIFQID